MIIGLGLDLCGIERMEKLLQDERFLRRYFAPEEQAYIRSRGAGAAASMAACFAAKEAFVKALGTGFDGIAPHEVLVLHDQAGQPHYAPQGEALRCAQQRGVKRYHLSLSHEGATAAAVAVLEGD